jgi:hypothetical protein
MNNTAKSLGSGLLGALALNILNETARRFVPGAPRLDIVGQKGLATAFQTAGATPPQGDNLYWGALVGDMVSNALYYGLVGTNGGKNAWQKGAVLGLASGLTTLMIPRLFGAGDAVNRKPRTQAMTVTWYVVGGLAAALAIRALSKK